MAAIYTITGDGNPSPNGHYFENGVYNGEPCYEREDGAFWIWWNSTFEYWAISVAPDDEVAGTWSLAVGGPPGEYSPQGTYTGNAVVAAAAPFAIDANTGEITIVAGFKDPTDFKAGYKYLVNPGDRYVLPVSVAMDR